MASICRDKNRRKRILFMAGNGSRKTIRLGKTSIKQAESFKIKLEALIAGRFSGSIDAETARWVAGLPDAIHGRLATAGLVMERQAPLSQQRFTVLQWINQYIESRPDVKQLTRDKWRNAANKLSAFFKEQPIDEITVRQAKDYRVYLKSVVGLSENTIRRLIGVSRQFFNSAIDAELIKDNPFRDQPVSVRANPARFYFVTQEMALKVLEECPDAGWRLIFGLCRWGGLRCPSEILRLKWQDVDFANDRFIVHASKTEHHTDAGIRTVPMFPELRPLFQDAFDNAKEGDIYCITRYRDKAVNLRTQMNKIIRRAGLEPWPKLFQNLRSTRETELFKMTNGNIKAVCNWIGNSPEVAMKHYAQVTEADLQEAAKMSLLSKAEDRVIGAAHNAAQYPAEQSGKERNVINQEGSKTVILPHVTGVCSSVHEQTIAEVGVEPTRPNGQGILSPQRLPFRHSAGRNRLTYSARICK